MELKVLRSMWSGPGDWDTLFAQTTAGGFEGIEGPIPREPGRRKEFRQRLDDAGLCLIAEATTGLPREGEAATGDWWVPLPGATIDRHLDDLKFTLDHAKQMGAMFVSTMCGYDAWSFAQNLEFFGRAIELEQESGVLLGFETHRCRSLFNPWVTRDLLLELPAMKVTCDFSHWCVVAERLIDTELDIIELVAERALHVQCRVGYAQHAQVADPRDPAYARALESHERWWSGVWDAQERRGFQMATMTPEFGAEGYMQTLPFTGQPVADLWDVTCWMGRRQRERFARRKSLARALQNQL